MSDRDFLHDISRRRLSVFDIMECQYSFAMSYIDVSKTSDLGGAFTFHMYPRSPQFGVLRCLVRANVSQKRIMTTQLLMKIASAQ